MSSELFHLGASHRKTPLSIREKLALPAEREQELRRLLAALPGLRELTVLNTCNRIEFYGVASDLETVEQLSSTFCQLQSIPLDDFSGVREHTRNSDTIGHLIRVASGLESQMLGENEIFGQVKSAYSSAQNHGTTGPVLNKVFQKAFHSAKQVRTHTALNGGQVSIANVAVDLAQKIFGQLTSTRVLLLGLGEIGEKTAKAFQSRGAKSLTISNRTHAKAMDLATMLDATALPFEHFQHHLVDFDVVVCSTSAPDVIVRLDTVRNAMRRRPARPLFCIDLALPRDVEDGIANLENVFVYNLDDLAAIAEANRAAREAEVHRAVLLVNERTQLLWQQVSPLLADSTPPSPSTPSAPLTSGGSPA